MKYLVIFALLAALGFLADRVVRVENQRYALLLGLCDADPATDPREMFACLDAVQTRPSWLWHLYNGLTDDIAAVPLLAQGD